MSCNHCGAELQAQEKFCPHCGAEAAEPIAADTSTRVMDTNSQSAGHSAGSSESDKPQQKRQSFITAVGGLVVAVIMMIILFAADYVIVAYITFIAPVVSFISIPRDKKNGHSGFIPTILINIITLIIAVILFVIYLKAVA